MARFWRRNGLSQNFLDYTLVFLELAKKNLPDMTGVSVETVPNAPVATVASIVPKRVVAGKWTSLQNWRTRLMKRFRILDAGVVIVGLLVPASVASTT